MCELNSAYGPDINSIPCDTINDSLSSSISLDIVDINSVNVLSQNIDGLFSKISDLDFLNFVEKFDVVCFLETFMVENNLPKNVFTSFLPPFFYPAKRSIAQGRASGGIIVLVKHKFKKYVTRIESEFHSSIVLHFKNILKGEKKNLILISSYIHPSGSNFYNSYANKNGISLFDQSFNKVYNEYINCEFLISGDFNSRINQQQPFNDLLIAEKYTENVNSLSFFDKNMNENLSRVSEDKTTNVFGKAFIDFVASYNLIVLNGFSNGDRNGKFTYISPTGNSVIDYFVVSDALLKYSVDMTVHSRVESQHMPITLCLNISDLPYERDKHVPSYVNNSYLRWDEQKLSQFLNECSSCNLKLFLSNLHPVLNNDVNKCVESLSEFYRKMSHMMYREIKNTKPVQNKKFSSNSFFDKECYQEKMILRKFLRKYNRNKSIENKKAYSEYRRNYKLFLNKKKQQYNQKQITSILSNFKNSKQFWKEIKSLTNVKTTYNHIDTNIFFNHFKLIYQKHSNPPPICYEENVLPYIDISETNESHLILNSDITFEEVENSIKKIKSDKSPGSDGVLNEMIKHTSPDVIPFLTALFQILFNEGIFPEEWAKSVIIPVYKKGDITNCNNFRPISVTSLLSKLYTNILNKRITNFVESNDILPVEQAGFREKFSTIDHIFTLYSMIQKQFALDRKLYVAFVDFSKCFDTVNKYALFEILERNGVKGKMLNSIKSIYEKVFACIRNGAETSDYFECSSNLKQGCILSPTLFNIFISEVSRALNLNCSSGIQLLSNLAIICHLFFADDVILVSDTVQGLQQKLNILEYQSKRLGIEVNLEKTKIIVFRKGGYLSKFEKWFYGGHPIEIVNSYVYLGFEFSTRMSLRCSTDAFIIKAKNALNTLFRSLNTIDCHEMSIFFKLFDSKVLPILSYSSELWGIFQIDEIEKVHTLAIKRFLNISIHSSNSIAYSETGRVPLYINHTLSSIKYWFKLLKKPNSHLSKQAYQMQLNHCLRGRDNWVSKLKNVLCGNGFGFLWMNQSLENEIFVLTEIKKRLTNIFLQTWNCKLSYNQHHQLYYSFKSFVTPEYYLSSKVLHIKQRYCLSKFRCGVSEINMHRYKYYNDVSLQMCPFCPNHFETEMHTVFFCDAYRDIRSKLIPEKFLKKSNLHTLIILISNESYQMILAKYLFLMFSRRKILLNH